METLLLNAADTDEVPMADVILAVENAFEAYARGDAQMPAKSYIDLPQYNGDFRSMPAYLDTGDWDAAVVKWVNVHPDNPVKYDLPTVMGTVIYADPKTAFPLAVLDGTVLTRKRTGAAAAVATDHLAVEDASSLGLIGAGVQSYTQFTAIAEVRPIQEVIVHDVDETAVEAFVDAFSEFDVRPGTVQEAASCDVLSTVTPADAPVVPRDAVGNYTHVNAIGADAEGKHEITNEILLSAKIVIDDYEQCIHSGEINVPWRQGILSDGDIHAELGSVVTGDESGRTPDDGVTLFDSTGLAIQDVAAAHVIFEHARDSGKGHLYELVGTDTA